MKGFAELLGHRAPTAEEAEAMAHVVELAEAWRDGGIDLAGVRRQCSGFERAQAMRFAPLGSDDKHLIMALVDALVAEDPSGFGCRFGWVLLNPEVHGAATMRTNADGRRVWVWPMHSMHGETTYPLVEVPRGDDRLRREQAATALYNDYRRKKRGER